jgi:serine/threonine protein kinase
VNCIAAAKGVVYLGVCDATEKQVAIKIIRDGSLATEGQRDRFEREIRVLAQLRHPNIVSVIDSGRVDGSGYLVMDYIDGCDLDVHVQREQLSIEDVLGLLVKVCEAVKAAHVRGVIHRDLKPGNIMVDARGEPHVLDFGLAKLRSDESASGDSSVGDTAHSGAIAGSIHTQTGQFLGSLPYASPEQARGDVSKVDVRTDVYALGVILYRILTGRFPYPVDGSIAEVAVHIDRTEPDRASKHREEICDQLDIILMRALAKSRGRRYQSVSELAADIERLLLRESIDARRDSPIFVLGQLAMKHRAITVALLAGVVTLAVSSAFFGYRLSQRTAELQAVQAERDALQAEVDRLRAEDSGNRETQSP